MLIAAIAGATVSWFVLAALLFFNPVVDKLYRAEEEHPAVRSLPQEPKTIGMIGTAVLVQCALWAGVYLLMAGGLPEDLVGRGLAFSAVIGAVKIVPRDVDRLLLTTYPLRRMGIEFVIGLLCALPVGFTFAWLL